MNQEQVISPQYSIEPTFLDVFKIGDNINYNIGILNILYKVYQQNTVENKSLLKPIIILNASIAEALLYDFIRNRIQRANRNEKILMHLTEIYNVKLSKFQHYIAQAKKYNLFESTDQFYIVLEQLAKARNRVHIQNDRQQEPKDEIDVFDEITKILSEKVIEKICNILSEKYPRNSYYTGYVEDFIFPWDKHFNI